MKKSRIVLSVLLTLPLLCALALTERASAGDSSGLRHAWTGLYYKKVLSRAHLKPSDVSNYSIGQSHIDAAWLWRVPQTRDKCVKTFGNAVKHMDMFPDFHYSQSAPQYYEWVKEDDPALFEKILEYEKQGRWEIVGGQWVEPDNNMPDGESFVRQRLLGQRFYQEHFGHISDISWLLDSFGYQWNLPQILAKSGARYFWTNKLTWNDTTVYPFHLFWWQGPDGSRVLAYFCKHAGGGIYPSSELGKYHDTRYLLRPGDELVADYSTDPALIREKLKGDWVGVVGVFYGRGDGGHGPALVEIERQQYLADRGYTNFATAKELYAALDPYADRAPVWNDELYLEYHRGVLTTQAWIKRANRQAEQMMRTAEVVSSIASRMGLDYAYEKLKALWKLVLLNQFHDILPGSSIPEVYQDARVDHEKVQKGAREETDRALERIASKVDTRASKKSLRPVVVFNALSWERGGIVEMPAGEEKLAVADKSGAAVPSQYGTCLDLEGECLYFMAKNMPSMGYRVYYLKPAAEKSQGGKGPMAEEEAGSISLDNGLVSVSIDRATGWLTSVRDLRSDKEFLDGYGNQLMAWKDHTLNYPAWNIEPDYLEQPRPMSGASRVEVTASGPLFVEVTAERRFFDSDITQVIRLYRDDPRVHLFTGFDFHEADTLVKAGFDTTIRTDRITAEISYAAIDRPTRPRTAAEKARWEGSCQRWLDLSDGEFGLALLNNGKYGYSLNDDGTGFRLTLIKGAQYPGPASEAVNVDRPAKPPQTDQGRHVAWTALLPHQGDWKGARLWRAGYEFNTPLETSRTGQHDGSLPARASFVSLDNPDVYVGALKRAEDGNELVLRLVEATGETRRVKVEVDRLGRIRKAVETDLLEWNPKSLPAGTGSISLEMKPHEIKTIKLLLAE